MSDRAKMVYRSKTGRAALTPPAPARKIMAPAQMKYYTRSLKYRLYPTRRQTVALEEQLAFGCDLYNAALEQRRDWFKRGRSTEKYEQGRELTEVRRAGLAPEGMNYACQQQALRALDQAFVAFFRRVKRGEAPGYPRFKPKQRFNTLAFRAGKGAAVKGDRLRIQGVGHIKVRWHRPLAGENRMTRITRKNGRWYATFVQAVEIEPQPRKGRKVGIDLGVTSFVVTSDGEQTEAVRARRKNSAHVRRQSRKVTRCQRGSNRRRKAVQRLARLREAEANRRRDQCHKLSRALVNRYDLIAHEDLRISQMVRGNRGLNREIHDQGWGQLLAFIRYKAESAGVKVVAVDPRYTSQTCAECGAVDAASRKGKRFDCMSCGHADDADVNAACNILSRAVDRTGPPGANGTVPLPEKPKDRRPSLHSRRRPPSVTDSE